VQVERVRWRAKQVSDYVALFSFAAGQSQFYLHLEDDVRCAPGFVADVRRFVRQQNSVWAMLEFSELGFIGKLFRYTPRRSLRLSRNSHVETWNEIFRVKSY